MISLERNALVTISPQYNHAEGSGGDFRWTMNVSMPFPFPAAQCVDEEVDVDGRGFRFGIHNHFDRVLVWSTKKKGWFRSQLVHKSQTPPPSEDCLFHREILQGVATFSEQQTYGSGNEAFGEAAAKISSCMEFLGRFLSKCQQRAPYLAGWLVYPFSAFEVGTIYHDVLHQSPGENWHLCASSVSMSLARHLQVPLFVMETLDEQLDAVVEGTNELLAEALVSLMRGTSRLTVLNSYGAVENLAQTILVKARITNLKTEGVPDNVATRLAEEGLARKKLDANELYHSQMKRETQRSVHDEKKQEYDALLALQRIRNDVAHRGYRPTAEEARNGHRTACEVTRWLCDVGGYPVKAMTPTVECTNPNLQVFSKDAFAKSEHEFAAIRALLGRLTPETNDNDRAEPAACSWPPKQRAYWPSTLREWLLLLRDALMVWR